MPKKSTFTTTKLFASRRTKPTPAGTPVSNPLVYKTTIAAIDALVASEGRQQIDSDPSVVVIHSVAMTTETRLIP